MKSVPHALAPAMLAGLLSLSGCANTDTAVFVTKTSLGLIDADTAPPNISIAYDRTEGFYGPSYDGTAPPVAALIQTSGSIFKPKIRQLYATGEAALKVASPNSTLPTTVPSLTGKPRMMFFGTSTTVGLKVTFVADAPIPSSLAFAYKRKEASYIPLQPVTGTADFRYPAVFASIDTAAETSGRTGTGLELSQFFATGHAAEMLAWSQRHKFKERVADAIADARQTTSAQRDNALAVLRAYSAFNPATQQAEVQKVWDDAHKLKLLDDAALARLRNPPPNITAGSIYANEIAVPDVDDPARATLLEVHLKTIRTLLNPQ